jgi:hypothetical protein
MKFYSYRKNVSMTRSVRGSTTIPYLTHARSLGNVPLALARDVEPFGLRVFSVTFPTSDSGLPAPAYYKNKITSSHC